MRILVLSWRDPKHPRSGGAEQVMHEHMKGWIRSGHSVTLFSSRFKNSKQKEIINGIKIERGGYQYLGVQFAGFFYFIKNKENFDFVVDQFHGLPFFTPLYVRKPKLAVIQETARKVWFLNPLPHPINFIIGALGYISEPFIFLLYRSSKFMTGSNSAREDIMKFGIPKENISVVPHGVLINKSKIKKRAAIAEQKLKIKTVMYLGILSKDKGVEDAIKCFSILNQMDKFQFWVVGRPETKKYGEKIRELADKMGLKTKIKFWGFVSQDKKFMLLSRAHVLINPSVHEGWGLVNIEANALATPVVAYSSAGLTDSIEDRISGIICKENTPRDLAENIFKLLQDDKFYEKLKKGASSWSKNFSWEISRKISLNLLKQIYES